VLTISRRGDQYYAQVYGHLRDCGREDLDGLGRIQRAVGAYSECLSAPHDTLEEALIELCAHENTVFGWR